MVGRVAIGFVLFLGWAAAQAVAGPTRVLDLHGRPVDPLRAPVGTVATVLVFTTSDCPISNRYAPEIARLAQGFRARGVRFFLVYPVQGDTPMVIRKHLTTFAYDLPALRDTVQELVTLTGVTVTPEAAVVDARGHIVYRGRIDDRYVDFGRDRPAPTTHDLEWALDAIVAGKPVVVRETRAAGCILADLVK